MYEAPVNFDFGEFLPIGFEIFFYALVLIFLIYSLFLVYHWFSYGTNKATSMLALLIYLFGSVPFLLIMSFTF